MDTPLIQNNIFSSQFTWLWIRYPKTWDFHNFAIYLHENLFKNFFEDYIKFFREYGAVDAIPTALFFYGLKQGEDTTVEIAKGKTLLIRLLSISPADEKGNRTVFFKLNGQTRNVDVRDRSIKVERKENKKADKEKDNQIGAPLQGLLSKLQLKNLM